MSKWITYEGYHARHLLPKPGCYALYAENRLIYVGQASNIKKRIPSYRIRLAANAPTYFYTMDGREIFARRFHFKVRYSEKLGDWAMREIRLIQRLKPPCNYMHGGNKIRRPAGTKKPGYQPPISSYDAMIEIMAEESIKRERENEQKYNRILKHGTPLG